tara:strand:- start:5304 stop:5705 length:402 start_codon:yes stop_codon:yes gene_type:complete
MSITAIRTELASNIGSISGIRTYADIPDNPAMPAAVVTLANVVYGRSFQRGLTEYNFVITVIFGRIATASAQRNLDALISTDARSLKTAVEADKTLDGNAFDTRVTEMTNVQSATIGDITYLTADFAVTVYAD